MRKLDRKLVRDLWHLKAQALAIVAVIAAGIATFVMSLCAYRSLQWSKDYFYREFRFADVFATTRRTPNSLIPRIEEISGVAAVQTRLVYDVLLDVPGISEPATARLISVPEIGGTKLNQLYISSGRMVEPYRTGEVVVSEIFAEEHGFVAGDSLEAIINGKAQRLTIVGTALSPEYVMQIRPGSIIPDSSRFAIMWINQRDLEAAFDMTGAFNSLAIKLAYGNQPQAVIDAVDQLLKPYGSVGAYDRQQQISHQYLSDELAQLRGMARMAPSIFLSVAAFLLNLVVSRIIRQHREQIAALKAFGYSNWEVGWHYLSMVLVIALGGAVAGTLLGFWMASGMTEMYARFYRFPVLQFQLDPWAVIYGFLLTTAVAVLGTWLAVHAAIRLPPAEAMRPEPPPSFKPTLLERMLPRKLVAPELRMVIRNIARKPVKASLSVLGVAMAVSVMILGNFSLDAVNYLMNFQFRLAQRQDVMVTFVEPATAAVVYEMAHLPGVLASETVRSVATRIHFENRSRRIAVMGLQTAPQLYRLLDRHERAVAVPEFGLMLNTKLAEVLGAKLGDQVTIEVLEEKRPVVTVEVTALVEEYAGLNAYMSKPQLHQLLKESSVATGAFLAVDANYLDEVYHQLELRPGVAGVTIKDAMLASFRETIAENILIMRSFIVFFAIVIAVGVVYNSARISLSERSRDLATMRVVGFTRREVSLVLLGEIALFTLAAIPLGWAIGYGLAAYMTSGMDTDNYRIPLIIGRNTYGLAALVIVVATLLSGWIVQRRVNHLDLVGVLKTRE